MKIAYVTMQFPAPAETFTANDVRSLRDAGMEISVHALRPADPAATRLVHERNLGNVWMTHGGVGPSLKGCALALMRPALALRLVAFVACHNWKNPSHLFKSLLLVPRSILLVSELRARRPDIIHLCWGHYPSLVGFLVQNHCPDPVLSISLVAYDLEMEYGASAPVAQRADMVRTLAQVNVEHIAKGFGVPAEKVTVLYDGVDMRRFRERDFWSEKVHKRIVTAGRLIKSKGMDDAIRVFANLLGRWPDASLVVLGDGPQAQELKVLVRTLGIEGAVTFRGHVSHDEVFEEMAKAEVFLFMSKKVSERLPNVVKEAMGCRCLCITTETPGIEELIETEKQGFVVPEGDVRSATRCVERAFCGELDTRSITDAAFAHLERRFDLERIMAEYLRHWRRLVAAKQESKPPSRFVHEKSSAKVGRSPRK